MELTVSDIAAIAAAIFAGGALVHSVIIHRKQKDLLRELGCLQRELTALQLKDAKERELSKAKADFTARFVISGSSKRLVITNVGSAPARDVRIDFGGEIYFVISSEIEALFPCSLDSSESVKLLATSSCSNRAVRESFRLTWMDSAGGGSKDFNAQYN